MCSGLVLSRLLNCLLILYIRNIYIVCIFNELLNLSCGLLSGLDGIYDMQCMSWRILLRNSGPDNCDRCLRSRLLLGLLLKFLFQLPIWIIFIFIIFNQVLELCFGNLSILKWFYFVCGVMSSWILRVGAIRRS